MSYLDAVKGLKFRVQKVEIEGITFYLRELSGMARIAYEGETDISVKVLKMMYASLCDENGNPTEKPEDFNDFCKYVPNKALNILIEKFSEINAAQKQEEELKNS